MSAEDLDRYKQKAEEYHERATKSHGDFLESCRQAGEALRNVKGELPKGEFKKWVKQNLTYSYDLAWRYMKVAKNWGRLAKLNTVQFMSLRGALRALKKGQGAAKTKDGEPDAVPQALEPFAPALKRVLRNHGIKAKPGRVLALLTELGITEAALKKALKPVKEEIEASEAKEEAARRAREEAKAAKRKARAGKKAKKTAA